MSDKPYYKVLLRFPSHLPGNEEWEGYDYIGKRCARCGERLFQYAREAPWAGSGPLASEECCIRGYYAAPHVLLSVDAEDEWLKDHFDEIFPFGGKDGKN